MGSRFPIAAGTTCVSIVGPARLYVQRAYVQDVAFPYFAAPRDRGWKCVVVCRALVIPQVNHIPHSHHRGSRRLPHNRVECTPHDGKKQRGYSDDSFMASSIAGVPAPTQAISGRSFVWMGHNSKTEAGQVQCNSNKGSIG